MSEPINRSGPRFIPCWHQVAGWRWWGSRGTRRATSQTRPSAAASTNLHNAEGGRRPRRRRPRPRQPVQHHSWWWMKWQTSRAHDGRLEGARDRERMEQLIGQTANRLDISSYLQDNSELSTLKAILNTIQCWGQPVKSTDESWRIDVVLQYFILLRWGHNLFYIRAYHFEPWCFYFTIFYCCNTYLILLKFSYKIIIFNINMMDKYDG